MLMAQHVTRFARRGKKTVHITLTLSTTGAIWSTSSANASLIAMFSSFAHKTKMNEDNEQ